MSVGYYDIYEGGRRGNLSGRSIPAGHVAVAAIGAGGSKLTDTASVTATAANTATMKIRVAVAVAI